MCFWSQKSLKMAQIKKFGKCPFIWIRKKEKEKTWQWSFRFGPSNIRQSGRNDAFLLLILNYIGIVGKLIDFGSLGTQTYVWKKRFFTKQLLLILLSTIFLEFYLWTCLDFRVDWGNSFSSMGSYNNWGTNLSKSSDESNVS